VDAFARCSQKTVHTFHHIILSIAVVSGELTRVGGEQQRLTLRDQPRGREAASVDGPPPLFPPLVSFNAYLVTCIFYRFVTGEFTRVEGEQQRHTPRNQRRWRKAAAVDAFARRRTRDRLAAPAQRAFAPNLRPDPSTREGNGGKRWLHAKPGGGAYIFISIFGAPFFFLGRLGPNLEPATGVVCGMHGLRNG